MKVKTPLLILITLLINLNVSATHMAGADLTYESLGGGQYRVTYTFYRDCTGSPAQTSIPLTIESTTCNVSQSEIMFPVPGTGQQISFVCPGAHTTCDGGTDPGIQKWEYTATITLTDSCPDWTFHVTECCRNGAISTFFDPLNQQMYIEAHLNNTVTDNNSPVFSNVPIAFECVNQDNYFNHGGLDADGDSLVYMFITPRHDALTDLTYLAGYSLFDPLSSTPSLSIDPVTGDIFMHPTVNGEITVVTVQIYEYRNEVLIGSVIRDIQIYAVNCNNQLPTASGVNGTNNYSLHTCLNGPVCFDIFTDDADSSQAVTALHNSGISGATFVIDTTGHRPVIHFCWPATQADVRTLPYFFTITVHDNACPSNGVQSFSYSIYLTNLQAAVSTVDVSCNGGHNGMINITSTDSTCQFMTTPGLFTTPHISHLLSGGYTINVTNAGGCTSVYYAQINQPAPLTVSIISQNANCAGNAIAIANPAGGTTPYTNTWNTSPPTPNDTISNIQPGTYTVITTDDHGCTSTNSVTISSAPAFTLNLTSTPATCNLSDGTVTAHTSGSNGPFNYVWTPNVSSGSNATNLPSGIYSVLVTDNITGCTQSATKSIANSSGLITSVSSTSNATCSNGDDGSASVSATGGQPPYVYMWSPGGQTTATVTNLYAGTYTVVVADYVGCPTYLQVTIGYDHAAPVVDLGIDSAVCTGDSMLLDAGAGGHGGSYLWNDGSTNQTLWVSSAGLYNVLVTDTLGCQSSDAVNITFVNCFGRIQKKHRFPIWSLSPNPVTGETTITLRDFVNEKTKIRIVDLQGSLVRSDEIHVDGTTTAKIDLSFLSTGSYMIQIINGENVYAGKFMKME
jgi:hypothetical protein